ncbi:hypothetical protein LV89_00976 [Arcicella aurantiaca]|uniref:Histidine Kinase domain-containing protein n=1 Tax=Arcicella aurantiaca TaxID=591202 RepID=A0A316EBH3_9BACT|nr:hypothetical protein [Arcicella aurantiaca]PWK28197.1 hypothetical protein LV89_00976 [Arcicella aurantiaca]
MQKDKIDFIVDLLADNRIEAPLKEKVSDLATKELKRIFSVESENRERILEIERKMLNLKNESTSNTPTNNTDEKPKNDTITPPNPLHTKNFLAYFRDSEGLKYLTHDYKDLANKIPRETLLSIAKKEFDEAKRKNPDVYSKLLRRVEEFAFKEKPNWTIRKGKKETTINLGWKSKEFIDWEASSLVHPCMDSVWNTKMIEPFKKTIEVRDGMLLEIIEETISLVFSKEDLDIFVINYDKTNLLSGRFFTDVDWFGQAIYKILSGTKKKAEKNGFYNISIEYKEVFENNYKCLKIIHLDSKPNRSSESNDLISGDFKDIRSVLWSLCNWAIEAEFSNGFRRKYLLWDTNIKETSFEIPKEEVKGFTHLLLFY